MPLGPLSDHILQRRIVDLELEARLYVLNLLQELSERRLDVQLYFLHFFQGQLVGLDF